MKKKYLFARHFKTVGEFKNGLLNRGCGTSITTNVLARCDAFNGINTIVRLINRDDIVSYTAGTPTVVKTAIVLASSKLFMKYEGIRTSQSCKFETIEKPLKSFYSHQVELVVTKADGATVAQLEAGVTTNLVALVEYLDKGTAGEMKYEIFGAEQGMKMTVTRDSKDADTGGAFKVTLKTDPERLEPHMPYKFWITDLATTDDLVVDYTTA